MKINLNPWLREINALLAFGNFQAVRNANRATFSILAGMSLSQVSLGYDSPDQGPRKDT